MMTENIGVRQIPGEPRRRWFSDEYFDLIVWLEADGSIQGFQLCYDKGHNERALTWRRPERTSHDRIDDGEDHPLQYKATPIVVADGTFDAVGIVRQFKAAAGSLPESIERLVSEVIQDFRNE